MEWPCSSSALHSLKSCALVEAISRENGSGMWRTTESPLGEEMSISLKRPRSVRSDNSIRFTAGEKFTMPSSISFSRFLRSWRSRIFQSALL